MLLLTRCFVGIGEGGYGPAAPTLIADLYPLARRGSVLSWFYMAIPVGSAIGFAVGGLVGAASHPNGWRWAFFVVTPPGLLLAAWCFFMRDPPRGQPDRVSATKRQPEADDTRLPDAAPQPFLRARLRRHDRDELSRSAAFPFGCRVT